MKRKRELAYKRVHHLNLNSKDIHDYDYNFQAFTLVLSEHNNSIRSIQFKRLHKIIFKIE